MRALTTRRSSARSGSNTSPRAICPGATPTGGPWATTAPISAPPPARRMTAVASEMLPSGSARRPAAQTCEPHRPASRLRGLVPT
eukprot:3578187-Prymnesium_polylepis.2